MTISPLTRRIASPPLFRWQSFSSASSSHWVDQPKPLAPSQAFPDDEIDGGNDDAYSCKVIPHHSLMDRAVAVLLAWTALPLGWMYCAISLGVLTALIASAYVFPTESIPHVKVAMIGNSMMYYNDFPRFMGTCLLILSVSAGKESCILHGAHHDISLSLSHITTEELSDGHLTQNSCLHGNANFKTILQWGVGFVFCFFHSLC